MQRLPGGRGAPPRGRHSAPPPWSRRAPEPARGGPDPRRLRLAGLTAAVAVALGLPLAASAGPLDEVPVSEPARTSDRALAPERAPAAGPARAGDALPRSAEKSSGHVDPKAGGPDGPATGGGDEAADDAAGSSRRLLGIGIATATRCGPELTSPDGIEAQTCVLTQGEQTWARTYYRNATGRELSSVLSMMAPGGHTVRMHCAVGAHDEPGACETPRERTRGVLGAYTAVAEFAAPDGEGPLLLRSGSNSGRS
ncbi:MULTISPECIES: hypothetical protein [Streptomyces]|uniref:hypothetical protein n=1 Tax=Streptomyces TaxID=1883 RepID=UPI001E5E3EE4|nr:MULTISPECIES: hypothetical protein [Streptomyces]MDW8474156.1 hypothetical protein [Streptomyces scabiei]MDX2532924.1 hypothetical protein [Streptomyces scabiei]MDX2569258.1 hypothetical protein [Streptomyces scabiei]MDX2574906.1 hypothetical protein [Streptomyces scabiei]MDX2631571.1 hypothetical protein [Streptomyces scabiei]